MAALHARFGSRLGPVTIPIGVDADFKGVIDVIRMKARYFDEGSDSERIEDIPAEYADVAQNARDKLCDLVAEADDELMMKYLDGEEQLTQEELESLLDKAIAQELFIPVFVGSTIIKQGVQGVMEDICTYFPHPASHGRFQMAGGDSIRIDESERPAAFVFKTVSDPFVGRLKLLQGARRRVGARHGGFINARTGKKERLGHLYVMMGKEATDVKSAKAGDIIVVPKAQRDAFGRHAFGDRRDRGRAACAAHAAVPGGHRGRQQEGRGQAGHVPGPLRRERPHRPHQPQRGNAPDRHHGHGRHPGGNAVGALQGADGRGGEGVPVRIPYRETIRKTAEAQGRHKKQTGGAGQFGDCWLRLEPNPGGGYEFLDEIVGGKIPRGFIPAIDKGVQDAMAEGFLAGYPMEDIKCAVFDGSYHAVDSNEMAFKTAARIGFRAACEKADPVLLEPMANLNIVVGEDYAGAVMGDVSTRRGRVVGTDSNDAGETVIIVRVPYAEVVTYTKDLRSITRGSGSYSITLEGYEEAPHDVTKKLVEAYQAARAAGN